MTESSTRAQGAAFFPGLLPTATDREDQLTKVLGRPAAVNPLSPQDSLDSDILLIAARKRKRRRVNLVGTVYEFTAPKTWASIGIAQAGKRAEEDPEGMFRAIGEWIVMGFGQEAGAAILGRLSDPEDDLDLDSLMTLIQKVMEASADGNPTG